MAAREHVRGSEGATGSVCTSARSPAMRRSRIRRCAPSSRWNPFAMIGPPALDLSLLPLLLLLLLSISRPVGAAWQQIPAWTDCGSTNFQTTRILVDFNDDTYWLNMTVEGVFLRQVVESDLNTNKASILPPQTAKCKTPLTDPWLKQR